MNVCACAHISQLFAYVRSCTVGVIGLSNELQSLTDVMYYDASVVDAYDNVLAIDADNQMIEL
jgi:hypothetical protein